MKLLHCFFNIKKLTGEYPTFRHKFEFNCSLELAFETIKPIVNGSQMHPNLKVSGSSYIKLHVRPYFEDLIKIKRHNLPGAMETKAIKSILYSSK